MRRKTQDLMTLLFDDNARAELYDLTFRKDPTDIATGDDHVFGPTISSIFLLFSEFMKQWTPNLYAWEWKTIVQAQGHLPTQMRVLPDDIDMARAWLLMSVEDLPSTNGEVSNWELSRKLYNLSDMEICAVHWHVQKYYVARLRNEIYEFPKISPVRPADQNKRRGDD